jgi:uncharacterized membrane protein
MQRGISGLKRSYTVNDEGHYVFREEHAKIRCFFSSFPIVFIVLLVILEMRFMLDPEYGLDWIFCLFLAAAAAVLAVVISFYYASRSKNYKIVLTDSQVDITVGKKHGSYSVADFEGALRQYVGSENKRSLNLLFKDPDDSVGKCLFVDVSGIPGIVIELLADKMYEFQDDGTEGYEPFKEHVYMVEPDKDVSFSIKNITGLLIALIVIAVTASVLLLLFVKDMGIRKYLLVSAETIGVILATVMIFGMRRITRSRMKTLSYTDEVVTVNDKMFAVDNISSVEMTVPNVRGDEFCEFNLTLKDSGKKVSYFTCKRIIPGSTEEFRSMGCSSEYPCLYLAIQDLCNRHGIKFN